MSEKLDPVITIELGGKQRHLKYDFKAMLAIQRQTGRNLLDNKVVKKIIEETTPEDLLTLLWGELLHEEPGLTIDEVTGWITMENQREVALKVIKAWAAAMPEGGKKKKAPLPK